MYKLSSKEKRESESYNFWIVTCVVFNLELRTLDQNNLNYLSFVFKKEKACIQVFSVQIS